jgi:hypothetical protein
MHSMRPLSLRLPAATAPGAPTLQSATADQQAGAVTVAFTAPPASDGGAPITGYRVRCRELPLATVASSSPATLPGLPRGRDLTFEVVAVNCVGPGPASAASELVRLGEGREQGGHEAASVDITRPALVLPCPRSNATRRPHPPVCHGRPTGRGRHRGLRAARLRRQLAHHRIPGPVPRALRDGANSRLVEPHYPDGPAPRAGPDLRGAGCECGGV